MCALLGKVTIKYEIYPICQKECADIRQKKTETKKEAVSYDTASLVYESLIIQLTEPLRREPLRREPLRQVPQRRERRLCGGCGVSWSWELLP